MRPNTSVATITGGFEGKKIPFTFDSGSTAHLMGVMSNLYRDITKAIVRELSTNAWDSHIAAGVSRPIEVSLPNNLSPYLVIKDYGLGLDLEDIANVYSRYGASTKRDTDSQTGMLGLGSKAPLAYTSQFSVTSVKDGVRHLVLVGVDSMGAGEMTVISSSETDESNGVTISIPSKPSDFSNFKSSADNIFQYWEAGTVVIDEVPNKGIESNSKIDAHSFHKKYPDVNVYSRESGLSRYNNNNHVIVMGKVAYSISSYIGYQLGTIRNLTIQVPIGSIDFTPSREELRDNGRTKSYVTNLLEHLHSGIEEGVQKEFDAALNVSKIEYSKVLRRHADNGTDRVLRSTQNDYPRSISGSYSKVDDRTGGNAYSNMSINVAHLPDVGMVVTGFPDSRHYFRRGLKAVKYAEQNGLSGEIIFAVDAKENWGTSTSRKAIDLAEWIEPEKIVSWKEVSKIKLPTVKRDKQETVYECFVKAAGENKFFRHSKTIEEIKNSTAKYKLYAAKYDTVEYGEHLYPDEEVIVIRLVNNGQVAKLEREGGVQGNFDSHMRQFIRDELHGLNDNQKTLVAALSGNMYIARLISGLKGSRYFDEIQDDLLKTIAKEFHSNKIQGLLSAPSPWSIYNVSSKKEDDAAVLGVELVEKYEGVQYIGDARKQVIFINALHADSLDKTIKM